MGFSSFSGLIVRPGIDRCNMTDGWPQPPHEGVVSAATAHQPSSLEDIYTNIFLERGNFLRRAQKMGQGRSPGNQTGKHIPGGSG